MRLIVGVTGSTGAILAVRLLEVLAAEADIDTHLVISKWGAQTLAHETDHAADDVRALATRHHAVGDMGAAIASGSFLTDGMVVIPCSMRSLAAIATGNGQNLIHRAADVTLKERRPLVLVPRETPLNAIHLQHMLTLAHMGVAIVPPMPAFYHRPETLSDMVDHIVARVLDQFGVRMSPTARWNGAMRGRRGAGDGGG